MYLYVCIYHWKYDRPVAVAEYNIYPSGVRDEMVVDNSIASTSDAGVVDEAMNKRTKIS
jgi:hypothetical protein